MDIPAADWSAAIPARHSRRLYDSRPLTGAELAGLEMVVNEFRPFPEARCVLLPSSPDAIFRGIAGSYGSIKGAAAAVFLGDMTSPYVQERVGYTGEGLVLAATSLGLATCWVGGFFRPEVAGRIAGARTNEQVLAVTPIGRAVAAPSLEERVMKGLARSHRRKPLAELVTGLGEREWPLWIAAALEAARLAPSAVNRQPWRFHVAPDSISVRVDKPGFNHGIDKRLDCGIAMLHIEVAALSCGVKGAWEFGEGLGRFAL